jgi:hypothetical protein
VLGGIGSLPGAVLGGLLIGLIETFWSAYFSIDYKDVAAFSILAIVLIFMPTGPARPARGREGLTWPRPGQRSAVQRRALPFADAAQGLPALRSSGSTISASRS